MGEVPGSIPGQARSILFLRLFVLQDRRSRGKMIFIIHMLYTHCHSGPLLAADLHLLAQQRAALCAELAGIRQLALLPRLRKRVVFQIKKRATLVDLDREIKRLVYWTAHHGIAQSEAQALQWCADVVRRMRRGSVVLLASTKGAGASRY
jgi:hypothetical protein